YPQWPTIPGTYFYPDFSDLPFENFQKAWENYKEHGLRRLTAASDQAVRVGVLTKIMQRSGSPRLAICDLAKTWHADLILMGSRGRSGLAEAFLGSVSNYVMHHAPCSVMVVRSPQALEKNSVGDSTQHQHQETGLTAPQ
ncbi:MAG: universal stress protein, partial [Acaryochloridaceae cyanobacterium CSU_5_19]|nr:universal stress protein [Acaryochloridaceae cyanobacterium CSU_5_19]